VQKFTELKEPGPFFGKYKLPNFLILARIANIGSKLSILQVFPWTVLHKWETRQESANGGQQLALYCLSRIVTLDR